MFQIKTVVLTISLFISFISANAAGDVDSAFGSSIVTAPTGEVRRILVQPDGKILVVGSFKSLDGYKYSGIARLNVDTSLDTTFIPTNQKTILSVALQSSGKILIGGEFDNVMRLNSNGTIDTTFINDIPSVGIVPITTIQVFSDDKFFIGKGNVGFGRKKNADGSLDTTSAINNRFDYNKAAVILPGDELIVASTGIRRLFSNGVYDTSFSSDVTGTVEEVAIQSDGKILVCGTFTQLNGFPAKNIIRLNSNGTVDTSFAGNFDGANSTVNGIGISPNGKIAITGTFTNYGTIPKSKVALLNSDGTLDTSYELSNNSLLIGFDVAFLPNGNLLVGSGKNLFLGSTIINESLIVTTNITGSIITSRNVSNESSAYKIQTQPDGKFIVVGYFNLANNFSRNSIARYNANGTLDNTFNGSFIAGANLRAIDFQSDGKIIVGGITVSPRRYNIDGTPDAFFPSGNGYVNDLRVKPNGKILLGSGISNFDSSLRQFNSDLTQDKSFVVNVDGVIKTIELLPDDKILIGGDFSKVNGINRGKIARLNVDGTLDTTFNPQGGANAIVNDIALTTNGKIIVAGDFTGFAFNSNFSKVIRLHSDGSLDQSFISLVDSNVRTIKLQPNGKVLIGGQFANVSNTSRKGIARLNLNGSLDSSFNSGSGTNGEVWSIDLQNDGKVIYCGLMNATDGIGTLGVGRLLNDNISNGQTKQFDFDGDGKADIAVFRPSTNIWYRLNSSNGSFSQLNFGAAADKITPADYDNDGKTDLSIFRPSTGTWWYRDLPTGNFLATQWGASGDMSLPSDFDGDGKADRVVFRPSNGVWYRLKSSNGQFEATQFGISSDVPVIVDFDGDGKSDIAVFRPSEGNWYWLDSSTGQFHATHFGQNGDLAVPADYDGDGKTELAVFRPSTGDWFFINSSTGLFRHYNFGLSADKPVAADYDGDGKADIAVYRPSTGTWYLQRSQLGFTSVQFGIAEDIPVPFAYIR